MFYFDHDTSASKDSRILMLRKQYGGAAVDAYWSIIEVLYTEEKPLGFSDENPEIFALSMWLCCDLSDLETWVHAMLRIGLLIDVSENDSEIKLWSERVGERVSEFLEKQETARQNGKKGGRPRKEKTETKPTENQSETEKNPGVSISLTNKNKNKNKNRIEEKEKEKEESENPVGFPLQCLAAFNEIMGTAYGGLPAEAIKTLNANSERYTVDEVRNMVRFKRDEWYGTQFQSNLTPKTLFSRDHFEQYIHQSKMPKPKPKQTGGEISADLSEYASAFSLPVA